MKPAEVARRLKGLSFLGFGADWEPGEARVKTVRRVLAYLEDRRVLFVPWNVEVPDHCADSVIEIRHFLTEQIGELDDKDDRVAPHLRAMRAECHQFLQTVDPLREHIGFYPHMGGMPGWQFCDALGGLRRVFGIHVGQLSADFRIDIDKNLASILPPEIDDSNGDDEPMLHHRRRH